MSCTIHYKVLILTSPCNIDHLCSTLCSMVTHTHTHTHAWLFLWKVGTSHRRNGFYTVLFILKNGFESVISIFCCSVSVGNISLHFQAFILPLIVIIQWDFCAPHRDLIWSSSVSLNDMKKQNKLRQTKSRRTVATSPRCFKKPSCKATVLFKVLGTCVKNAVINRFSLSIN